MSGAYVMIDEFHGFGLSYEEVCERFSLWARGANVLAPQSRTVALESQTKKAGG